jgi:hypothetical protein
VGCGIAAGRDAGRRGKDSGKKKIKKWWDPLFGGGFGGALKMQAHLEVLLELIFCIKFPNFGVEAHLESPTGVALTTVLSGVASQAQTM